MIVAGVAVGIVGLLQASGVAQRYPNPDGREPDDSQDFIAQGLANTAGSFFQAMPSGGSLSSTALGASAGAQTRWASFFMAIVVMVAVLAFANVLSLIPIAALAALLIYSAALSIKFDLIQDVLRTNWHSWSAMLITFVAALVIPLQQAIMLGVIVACVFFIHRSSSDIRVVRLRQQEGRYAEEPLPSHIEHGETLILDIYGSLFFAGARTLSKLLPPVDGATDVIVVLRLRGLGEVGSTLLNVLNAYAADLQAGGGDLFLAGIDPEVKDRMIRARQAATISPDHIFTTTSVRHESIDAAVIVASKDRHADSAEHTGIVVDQEPADSLDRSQSVAKRRKME
jgi:SulP family sulfate permease